MCISTQISPLNASLKSSSWVVKNSAFGLPLQKCSFYSLPHFNKQQLCPSSGSHGKPWCYPWLFSFTSHIQYIINPGSSSFEKYEVYKSIFKTCPPLTAALLSPSYPQDERESLTWSPCPLSAQMPEWPGKSGSSRLPEPINDRPPLWGQSKSLCSDPQGSRHEGKGYFLSHYSSPNLFHSSHRVLFPEHGRHTPTSEPRHTPRPQLGSFFPLITAHYHLNFFRV